MYFLLNATNATTVAIAETSSFINSELFSALIASFFTLLGVFIGNFSARRTAKSQEQIRLLAEFYSEVFSKFSSAAPLFDGRDLLPFILSCEKAKLLCSKKSEKILSSIIQESTEDSPSIDTLSKLIIQLRDSAKEDLRKR